jgi:hypothetical protein
MFYEEIIYGKTDGIKVVEVTVARGSDWRLPGDTGVATIRQVF